MYSSNGRPFEFTYIVAGDCRVTLVLVDVADGIVCSALCRRRAPARKHNCGTPGRMRDVMTTSGLAPGEPGRAAGVLSLA